MVLLNEHSVAQIFVLLVVSVIFQLFIVISNPMKDKIDRRITLIIEVTVSIYLYVLLSLTDFMGENTLREELGWILTILNATIVVINLLLLFWKCYWKAESFIKQRFPHLFV
jgi:hypothetical protein